MDNIYVYLTSFPPKIHEMVAPCLDGYTIYIDEKLDQSGRIKAYLHALNHIKRLDHERENVGLIEFFAHKNDIYEL